MKRLLFAVLIFAVITKSAQGYSGGSGTADDPYKISNLDDLLILAAPSSPLIADFRFSVADLKPQALNPISAIASRPDSLLIQLKKSNKKTAASLPAVYRD